MHDEHTGNGLQKIAGASIFCSLFDRAAYIYIYTYIDTHTQICVCTYIESAANIYLCYRVTFQYMDVFGKRELIEIATSELPFENGKLKQQNSIC